jgi:hypothetical protein
MILYLARNESINLLDKAASENSLHIRKLSGNFSLSEFIVKDMRKYASCRYFCVERAAADEKDNEFLEALKSFQMMFSARVIVIYETEYQMEHLDSFTRELAQIGVTDIVTAFDMDEKLEQIAECLSADGMTRYMPKPKPKTNPGAAAASNFIEVCEDEYTESEPEEERVALAQSLIPKQLRLLAEMEDEQYRFDCLNVSIGVIGATRRVGTTTIALGLANFIKNHGGTACYAAINMNHHLKSIADAYNFDTEEDYYTYDAIDFCECMLPKHDYNFVIMDYGDMKREAVRKYKESDIHILCGASYKMHEVAEFSEALKSVKSVKPQILTYAPNPEYRQLFNSTVTKEPVIVKPVRDMLDFRTNGLGFKGIIQPYIIETSKRL